MNENNKNFDELKRLLKLKRHEIPPPGYFNNFSGEVISRIRAGETGGSTSLAEQLRDVTVAGKFAAHFSSQTRRDWRSWPRAFACCC